MQTFPDPRNPITEPEAIQKARQILGAGILPDFKKRLAQLTPIHTELVESGIDISVAIFAGAEVDRIIRELSSMLK